MSSPKTRIFIDFWNLQLNINGKAPSGYRLDWTKLSPLLINEATALLGTPLDFDGTNVYVSYNPSSPPGKRLRNWCINTLDRFPGVRVTTKERKSRKKPVCPNCHQQIAACPHCNGTMERTIEKGIDTAIATDMISLAWEGAWEVGILVSSDRDHIPAVDFLTNKGLRVINVFFPPDGMHLARNCWASIDLTPHLAAISR